MSFGDHQSPHLPPLALPPRQLRKVRISCNKWLSRFITSAGSAAGVEVYNGHLLSHFVASLLPPPELATGFVALNGGILAGCTPYDLRQMLEANGLVNCASSADHLCRSHSLSILNYETAPSSKCILEYSSMLPFVLCNELLQLPSEGVVVGRGGATGSSSYSLSVLNATLAELAPLLSSAAAASPRSGAADIHDDKSTKHEEVAHASPGSSSAVSGVAVTRTSLPVVVLQVPPSVSLWRGGSTSSSLAPMDKGCGFLYLVSCDVATVRSHFHHLLQRPVVGVERLLSLSSMRCDTSGTQRGSDRCTCSPQLSDSPVDGASSLERRCTSRSVRDVPGLFLVEDFVTADEEKMIWEELYAGRKQLQLEYLSRRRVAHFNRRFWYGVNTLTDEGVMVNARPSFYGWMRARLQNDPGAGGVCIDGEYPFRPGDYECDQLTVNYYDYSEMGACGIAAHVDAHRAFDDAIFIVSLGSYTVMEFSRWDSPERLAVPVGVYLAPRSLAVMTGEARYGWTHCIAEKRTDTLSELLPSFTRGDRVSLTWRRGRTQLHTKEECPYPALCDCE